MSELRSNESPRSGSDKTILFRKETEAPVGQRGWFYGSNKRNLDKVQPYPVSLNKTIYYGLMIDINDFLWYGSVPEVRILP